MRAAPPAPRVAAVVPRPAPPPPAPARVETPRPAARALGRGYRLQIAAVRSPEAAKQEWERLRRLHSDVLGSLGFATERVDLGARGVFYRIQAGPVADAAQAEHDCNELKQRGVGCLLVKP
jgi:cell division septation protein DedD